MGEYADLAIEEALNQAEWLAEHPEEFDDPMDGGWFYFGRRRRKQTKTCKFCGQTGLVWSRNEEDKWRLHEWSEEEEDLVQHLC